MTSLADTFSSMLRTERVSAFSEGMRAAASVLGQRTGQAAQFTRLPMYAKQAAIIDDPARFTITEATTKAGKTFSHIEWLLEQAIGAGSGEWWWVATTSDVADIAFRRSNLRLQGYIETKGTRIKVSEPFPYHANLARKFITLGGATVWFKSADEPNSLYGEDVRGAVGDEITRWKPEAWHALYTTLTATGGCAKLIGNVKGRRNFAYLLARKAEAGEPGWGYHRLTASDAVSGGVISQAAVDQARRDLPDPVFRELYLAQAADDQGNPFGMQAIGACVQPLSSEDPVVWGWDLGRKVDWTVGVALDRNGVQCRPLDRFQLPWPEAIRRIREVTGSVPALVDSTGAGDGILPHLQAERSNFYGFIFTSLSKQQIMEGLAVAIQRGETGWFDPVMTAELEAFEYEYRPNGVRYSAPSGMHDDTVCALALANHHLRSAGLAHGASAIGVGSGPNYFGAVEDEGGYDDDNSDEGEVTDEW